MKHTQLYSTLLMLAFFATSVSAQSGLKKANKEYDLQAYNLAVPKYLNVLAKKPNSTEVLVKLADCYFHQNYFVDAERYFKKAVQNDDFYNYKSYLLPYGKSLMAQGKYNLASNIFSQYSKVDPFVGNHFVESCESVAIIESKNSDYVVKNEYNNSKDSDFGPAFFQNGNVVFSSARNGSNNGWNDNISNKLYISKRDHNNYLTVPAEVRSKMSEASNEGPLSYSKDGKWVAYTKNNFTNGIRHISPETPNLSIYIAEVLPNGDWQNEKPFAYNGSGYSSAFPSFADNGTTLYFASNRPDGLGGFDIFVSTKNGSSWSVPLNLGSSINTPGNEVTPFYNAGELHFASDWHSGLGGLDIFKALKNGNSFINISNLGNGVNSSYDDYGFIYDYANEVGYLTSNRKGGKGKEDIYRLTSSGKTTPIASSYGEPMSMPSSSDTTYPSTASVSDMPIADSPTFNSRSAEDFVNSLEEPKLTIILQDAVTKKPIANAKVNLSMCNDLGDYRTDVNGKFSISEFKKMPCEIIFEPEGYYPMNMLFERLGEQPEEFVVPMSKATVPAIGSVKPTTSAPAATTSTATTAVLEESPALVTDGERTSRSYKGSALNSANNSGIDGATVIANNRNNQQILETMTDQFGDFWLSLDQGASYEIIISKEGYGNATKVIATDDVTKGEGVGALKLKPGASIVSAPPAAKPAPAATTRAPLPTVNNTTTTATKPAPASKKKWTAPAMPDMKKEGRFAIQLAAKKGKSKLNTAPYSKLTDIGDLYQTYEKGYTKLRLGFFSSKSAATTAKKSAEKKGFKDAYIVNETSSPTKYSGNTNTTTKRIDTTTNYKIRLASLTKPQNFDRSKVQRYGTIESKKVGKFTVFMLSGYSSKSTAKTALAQAKKAGFKDAQLVKDSNGKLIPVK